MFLYLCCALCHPSQGAKVVKQPQKEGEFVRGRAPASPSPLNIDPTVDCALKELAWTYAKKLLPQVCSESQSLSQLRAQALSFGLVTTAYACNNCTMYLVCSWSGGPAFHTQGRSCVVPILDLFQRLRNACECQVTIVKIYHLIGSVLALHRMLCEDLSSDW